MAAVEYARKVFVGAMLGDGSIQKTNAGGNARFRVGHSIDKSEYLMWKLKHLRELVPVTDIGIIKGGKYTKSPNDYVYFNSRRTPYVTEMFELLYKDGKKVITTELLGEFDDTSLAVLFMDDGSYDANIDNLNYWLHLNSHTEGEILLFCDYLRMKYDLDPKIQHVNRGEGYGIRFQRKDSERIDEIIRPTVTQISCMRYKLHRDNPELSKVKYSKVMTDFLLEAK